MPLELKIVNRSNWPDWFVKPICKWIVKRAGINHRYRIILPSYSNRSGRAGRGSYGGQRSRMNRRYNWRASSATSSAYSRKASGQISGYPYQETYHRYAWAKKFQINNPMEAMIHLIAHECGHASVGMYYDHKGPDGKRDVAAMEMACENLAHETVEEFRKLWPILKPKLMAKLRADRQRRRGERMRIGPSSFAAQSLKRDKAQAALDRWEKKAKIAATYIKKYRRRLNCYQGRMAANTGDRNG